MRWYRFGTDFFVCDCEKLKMYWMYIQFFGKKQAGKDVPKMCRRINQRFLKKCSQKKAATPPLRLSFHFFRFCFFFSSFSSARKESTSLNSRYTEANRT